MSFEISAIIPLEGENLMHTPLKFGKLRRKTLIDTGACANAMPAEFYEKLKNESSDSISDLQQTSFINVKVASGRTVKVLAQIQVKFHVNHHEFTDTFLIPPSMNSVVIGNLFFKKYNIEISPADNLSKLTDDISVERNQNTAGRQTKNSENSIPSFDVPEDIH